MVSQRARRIWGHIAWTAAVWFTILNGFVVGYGSVWFQLFGDTADAEDYHVSLGGYAAAAAVLTFAVPAIAGYRGPRWLTWPAVGFATLYAILAFRSALLAGEHPVRFPTSHASTYWDGVGGVVWAPWTWVLVILGVAGTVRLLRHPTAPGEPRAA